MQVVDDVDCALADAVTQIIGDVLSTLIRRRDAGSSNRNARRDELKRLQTVQMERRKVALAFLNAVPGGGDAGLTNEMRDGCRLAVTGWRADDAYAMTADSGQGIL